MNTFECSACGRAFTARQDRRKFCSLSCSKAGRKGGTKAKHGTGSVDPYGYRMIYANGRRVREHRHVMELVLGRPLLASEVVHHRDGNRLNNSPSNLELLSGQTVHTDLHRKRFISETHKECWRCETIKPRSDFPLQGKGGHTTDLNAGCCRSCAAEVYRRRKATKRGTCPECGREDVYLASKGLCASCYARHRVR